jgi:hypothetical protein
MSSLFTFDICCRSEQNIDLPAKAQIIGPPIVVGDTKLPVVVSDIEPPVVMSDTKLLIVAEKKMYLLADSTNNLLNV